MADITLAEFNGRVWLVGGEAHLQALLANTLPKNVSIELLACERLSDVTGLWQQHCGPQEAGTMPWQIHPAIVDRIRRHSPDHAVFFAQWSAALDAEALAVINAAAAWARDNPATPVTLVEYVDAMSPQAIADLARLRASLVADRLAEAGIERARLAREVRPIDPDAGMGQESQRLDIIVAAG